VNKEENPRDIARGRGSFLSWVCTPKGRGKQKETQKRLVCSWNPKVGVKKSPSKRRKSPKKSAKYPPPLRRGKVKNEIAPPNPP